MLNQQLSDIKPFGITFNSGQKATARVWHTAATRVAIQVEGQAAPVDLIRANNGYWEVETAYIRPGDLYSLLVDGERIYPDPASLVQPHGPYGPSEAVDLKNYYWEDGCWVNPDMDAYRLVDLDLGSCTAVGTFDEAIPRIRQLKKTGVTAVVISPTQPVSNAANLYDTSPIYSIQPKLGTPQQLQHLINACHYEGVAVTISLDYSLVCPTEANRQQVEHFQSRRLRTAWVDQTLRVDRSRSEASMLYALDNALMWFRDFHADALRLSNVHALPDSELFLNQLRNATDELTASTNRQYYLLIDSDTTQPVINCQYFHHLPEVEEKPAEPATEASPNTLLPKPYRQAYVYNTRFASILKSLFNRRT
ncbi:alpha-amylase family glycosyl hydrolase [Fibrella aquatica]|uniref:alpha-amylase family glycosyl hydrolase n=1 Tax=Fibrella aquatica TaxID=3242487 RepID=UPI00351FF057